jgi:putative tryptophan/tyrosine transport system substrate-binding protein
MLAVAIGAAASRTVAQTPSRSAGKLFRIGFLANHIALADLQRGSGPPYTSHGVFIEGMRKLGWQEGTNIEMHWRSAESRYERLPRLADELVRIPVDLIVAFSEGVDAAAKATQSIPVVMGDHVRPVEAGLALSLARPGRNVTGLVSSTGAGLGKSLSLLKETAPGASRVAMLIHSGPEEWVDRTPSPRPDGGVGKVGSALGIDLFFQVCRDATALDAAIRGCVLQGAQAIWVEPNYGIYKYPEAGRVIAREAIRRRVPVMQGVVRAVEEGGLMAHGVDYAVGYRRVPYFVDRILRGDKPGELPIEQPTRVEFHVNLKAAKAIGLTFPASVLLQADRVID